MRAGQQPPRLLAAVAPLLPPGDAARRPCQPLLPPAVVTWMLDHLPLRRHQEHLQPHVDPRLPPRRWERLRRYLRTGATDIPAIGLARDRDGFGRAFQWAGPAHREAPDLRQHQVAGIQSRAAVFPRLRIGAAVVPLTPLEAGV